MHKQLCGPENQVLNFEVIKVIKDKGYNFKLTKQYSKSFHKKQSMVWSSELQ
jgi:hypothetical protein